jgi:hypothetical protein
VRVGLERKSQVSQLIFVRVPRQKLPKRNIVKQC